MFLLLLIVAATFSGGLTDNLPNGLYSNGSLWLLEQQKGEFSDPTLYQTGSQQQEFAKAAIASDAPRCAKIAKDILKMSGASIADATIAAIVCYGAVNPGYSGIGGGLQLVHYSAKDKVSSVLVSREMAPGAATETMFDDDPEQAKSGGLAVAVPGEIKGMMELYKRFGGKKVPWADLFKPTIKMLRADYDQEDNDEFNQGLIKQGLLNHPSIRCDQWNVTQDCSMYKSISQERNSLLADTLQKIADSNGNAFYDPNNQLCKSIAADIQDEGGIIKTSDLAKFTAKWVTPVTTQIDNLTMHTSPPPAGGGSLVAFIMRVVASFKVKSPTVESYQYLVEGMKHAFGTRPKLGDPDDPRFTKTVNDAVKDLTVSKEYLEAKLKKISATQTSQDKNYYMDRAGSVRPDHGTAAFAIVGTNGDAIVLTTTLNFYGGAGFSGSRTGIQFNNQMQDFSYKGKGGVGVPVVANYIRPGKRPLSSASPSVFVEPNGKVRLVAAGIGGILIPGAVTHVILNNLYFGKSMKDSLDAPRLHHLLEPMQIYHENDFDRQIIRGLESIGHRVQSLNSPGSACVGIMRTKKGSLIAG